MRIHASPLIVEWISTLKFRATSLRQAERTIASPHCISPYAGRPDGCGYARARVLMWGVLIAGSTGTALRAVRPSNLHITPECGRDFGYAASVAGSSG